MPDLNLLSALDVLLQEGSVVGAARRLGLSASAMSRTLARVRAATGDPLLARSGRGLVLTPRALELRDRVAVVVQDGTELLRPAKEVDPARLAQTFTLRTGEGFIERFGPQLIRRVQRDAPGVRLRLLPKALHTGASLREGTADLETGVVGSDTPSELRTQLLFRDRLVGVVRRGHPLARRRMTAAAFAKGQHVEVARHVGPGALDHGLVEEGLMAQGLEREIVAVVGGFAGALSVVRASDLIAVVPERHTSPLRKGMHTFRLPFPTPELVVSLVWHPRVDKDPANRWLRGCVRALVEAASST